MLWSIFKGLFFFVVILGIIVSIIIPPLLTIVLPIVGIPLLIVGSIKGFHVVFIKPFQGLIPKKAPPTPAKRQRPPP